MDPWYCNQAHCDVITDASQHFLALTQRKAVWSGPRQLLDPDLFNSIEDLKTTFNFSMYSESSESIHAEWKIKVEKGQETQYFSLFGSIGKSFILRCHSQMTHLLFVLLHSKMVKAINSCILCSFFYYLRNHAFFVFRDDVTF